MSARLYYRPKPSNLSRFKAGSSLLVNTLEAKYGTSFCLNVDDDWDYLNELSESGVVGAKNLCQILVEYGQLELEIR